MPDTLLGLGGNLGDPIAAIGEAVRRLGAAGLRIGRCSSCYRTRPWGGVPQPDFVNLCAAAETDLPPHALLALCKSVERDLGRVAGERWGPRPIDIDILTYGTVTLAEPDLALPHPRLTERAFVLVPLAEIAPDAVVAGRSVRDWLATVDATGITRLSRPPACPPA